MSGARLVRTLRALGVTAGALAALAALAAGALWWVVATEAGTRFLVGAVERRLDGVARLDDVRGTLLAGLAAREVVLELGADTVTITEPRVVLNPWALAGGTLEIAELAARDVVHRRRGDAAPAGGRFELPLRVRVERAVIARLAPHGVPPEWALEELAFAARAGGMRIELDSLSARSGGFALDGRAALDAAAGLAIDAAVAWSGELRGAAAAGELEVGGTLPRLAFRHELRAPFPATAEGTLSLGPPLAVAAVVEWRDLALPGLDGLTSAAGRAEVDGGLEALRFSGAASAVLAGHPAELTAAGTVDRDAVALDALTVSTAHGALDAAGTFAFAALAWDATFSARGVDPSAFHPDWPGRVDARGTTRGALRPTLEWTATIDEARGELRGYPLDAAGTVAGTAGAIRLDAVRVSSGDNRLAVDGRVADALELRLAAELEDLGLAWPGLEGTLTADLAIEGPRTAPLVRGTASARRLDYAGWHVEQIDAAGAAGADAAGRIELAASGLRRGPVDVERVRAELVGTPAGHELRLAADAEQWDAVVVARGGVADGLWRGTVDELAIDQPALGEWRLAEAAAVRLGRGSVALDTSCIAQQRMRLCAELRFEGGERDALVVSAQSFELGALAPFLPPELDLAGVYQLSASFTDLARAPRGSLSIVGGPTRVSGALEAGAAPLSLAIDEVVVTAELADWRLAVDGRIDAEQDATLTVRAEMADIRRTDSPIAGELRADWPDIGVAALLSPDVDRVAGAVSVALEVAGTAADPQVDGEARLRGGEVSVPAWGLVVTDIEADAMSADGRALRFTATGRVEDRTVELEGVTELDPAAGWPTELTLVGDAIHAVARPDADIFVSPNLRAVVRLPAIDVTGTVHVPRARVMLAALPEQAVTTSADAVVHGVVAERPARPLRMSSDLSITLGEEVTYSGGNLEAAVAGEMRLRRGPDAATIASGSLRLNGTYNAYGQTLTLDRGQLLFTGPLDDPSLDVRAVRRIESRANGVELVGVELTGTVKAPVTRIYSEPPTNEADALSYLLFGRPLTGTGSEETATLQTAAVAMGLQQALPVVQRIGQSLGLDEFTVQTTDADAGALMAGKYLSPKVYIRYSYGLFNRIGGLLLRFRVNERLSIETRSGDQKSMDLLYTVEKD